MKTIVSWSVLSEPSASFEMVIDTDIEFSPAVLFAIQENYIAFTKWVYDYLRMIHETEKQET